MFIVNEIPDKNHVLAPEAETQKTMRPVPTPVRACARNRHQPEQPAVSIVKDSNSNDQHVVSESHNNKSLNLEVKVCEYDLEPPSPMHMESMLEQDHKNGYSSDFESEHSFVDDPFVHPIDCGRLLQEPLSPCSSKPDHGHGADSQSTFCLSQTSLEAAAQQCKIDCEQIEIEDAVTPSTPEWGCTPPRVHKRAFSCLRTPPTPQTEFPDSPVAMRPLTVHWSKDIDIL